LVAVDDALAAVAKVKRLRAALAKAARKKQPQKKESKSAKREAVPA
jgi:hypothetical protein